MHSVAIENRGFSKAFQAALDGVPLHRATPADAFAAAREEFLACRRIEMRDLAERLGVSRTTMYNWCGDRDQLLIDVLWSIAAGILDDSWARHDTERGVRRFALAAEDVLRTLAAAPALQALLRNETHAALRLLTGRGGVHDRFVAWIVELLDREVAAGEIVLEAPPELLAEAVVCAIESGLYNDNIASVEPEIDRTLGIIELLLRGAQRPAAAAT